MELSISWKKLTNHQLTNCITHETKIWLSIPNMVLQYYMALLLNFPQSSPFKFTSSTKVLLCHQCSMLYGTVLEITVGHWPFSNQFQHLADQNPFWLANFTVHFFNGMAINNLQNVLSSKNG